MDCWKSFRQKTNGNGSEKNCDECTAAVNLGGPHKVDDGDDIDSDDDDDGDGDGDDDSGGDDGKNDDNDDGDGDDGWSL